MQSILRLFNITINFILSSNQLKLLKYQTKNVKKYKYKQSDLQFVTSMNSLSTVDTSSLDFE